MCSDTDMTLDYIQTVHMCKVQAQDNSSNPLLASVLAMVSVSDKLAPYFLTAADTQPTVLLLSRQSSSQHAIKNSKWAC